MQWRLWMRAPVELLAGSLPPKDLRAVQRFLDDHRQAVIEAFERTLRHDFPGRLGEATKEDSDG